MLGSLLVYSFIYRSAYFRFFDKDLCFQVMPLLYCLRRINESLSNKLSNESTSKESL